MGKLMLLSIIAYALFVYHLFFMFSPSIQWCLGCDQTFQFAPYAPQHNHHDYPHLKKTTQLVCLEFIGNLGF
jgi:hypothetical protein